MVTKSTLALDFDGVVHAYRHGWRDGVIYDEVTPGFFAWAKDAEKHFDLVIYSTRSATAEGRANMRRWLHEQWRKSDRPGRMPHFKFAAKKPLAFLTIDDRALTFEGNWADFSIDRLKGFKPWNT